MRRTWAGLGAGAFLAAALRRRPMRGSFIGVYRNDGLLTVVAPASSAGLALRAAAGDVIRALLLAPPEGAA